MISLKNFGICSCRCTFIKGWIVNSNIERFYLLMFVKLLTLILLLIFVKLLILVLLSMLVKLLKIVESSFIREKMLNALTGSGEKNSC